MNWRIVVNEVSGRYRVEIRRWWGWDFALDDLSDTYRSFDSYSEARRWACAEFTPPDARYRRWRIVDLCCNRGDPSG